MVLAPRVVYISFSSSNNTSGDICSHSHSDNDIIDGNEDQFDDVSDESHNRKPDGASKGDFLKLSGIWLCAPLQQSLAIDDELQKCSDTPAWNWYELAKIRSSLRVVYYTLNPIQPYRCILLHSTLPRHHSQIAQSSTTHNTYIKTIVCHWISIRKSLHECFDKASNYSYFDTKWLVLVCKEWRDCRERL